MGPGNQVSPYLVVASAVVIAVFAFARLIFAHELAKTDPALYEQIGRPGDNRLDGILERQVAFTWWLLRFGYLALEDPCMVVLAAIQHVVLLLLWIGIPVCLILLGFICPHALGMGHGFCAAIFARSYP